MLLRFKRVTFIGVLAVFLAPIFAEENAEQPKKEIHYFDVVPPVIVNYQKPGSRRLGFVTVDIQLQTSSVEAIDLIEMHKPLIDDAIIDVMNSLDEATVKDVTKRNEIRKLLQQRLASVLKEETGKEAVDDVLFTKFVYQ